METLLANDVPVMPTYHDPWRHEAEPHHSFLNLLLAQPPCLLNVTIITLELVTGLEGLCDDKIRYFFI